MQTNQISLATRKLCISKENPAFLILLRWWGRRKFEGSNICKDLLSHCCSIPNDAVDICLFSMLAQEWVLARVHQRRNGVGVTVGLIIFDLKQEIRVGVNPNPDDQTRTLDGVYMVQILPSSGIFWELNILSNRNAWKSVFPAKFRNILRIQYFVQSQRI